MNRFEKRRRKTTDEIARAAVKLATEKGLPNVSLEEISQIADVSRATLYNHYRSREDLLVETLAPLFVNAIGEVDSLLSDTDTITIPKIADFCVRLWESHRDKIGIVGPSRSLAGLPGLAAMHREFLGKFQELFLPLMGRYALRLGDARKTGLLVYSSFIPIIDTLSEEQIPDMRNVFADMLTAMVTA